MYRFSPLLSVFWCLLCAVYAVYAQYLYSDSMTTSDFAYGAMPSPPTRTPEQVDKFSKAMHYIYRFPPPETAGHWVPAHMSGGHNGRYLWTDAFGVLNFITLYKETSDPYYLSLAETLVSTVHAVLGRTRDGKSPLPGATPEWPLNGGLRIGKEDETGDNGDGQYHHYLTLWMFALNRLSIAASEPWYNTQAVSLAKAIHTAFVYDRSADRPRMVWKMNTDLTKALVESEGNSDPITGYVVFKLLQETEGEAVLSDEIADYARMVDEKWGRFGSSDPLDLGMVLWAGHWFDGEEEWATGLIDNARVDLRALFDDGYFDSPVEQRLAFRDFGACMGIKTGASFSEWDERAWKLTSSWEKVGLIPKTVEEADQMDNLLPITLVMYASALMPGAFMKGYLQ